MTTRKVSMRRHNDFKETQNYYKETQMTTKGYEIIPNICKIHQKITGKKGKKDSKT